MVVHCLLLVMMSLSVTPHLIHVMLQIMVVQYMSSVTELTFTMLTLTIVFQGTVQHYILTEMAVLYITQHSQITWLMMTEAQFIGTVMTDTCIISPVQIIKE